MKVWIEAARPRTLSAAIAPVLVGTAATETFIAWRFVLAMLVSLSIQVGVNYANDLFDGLRGIDTEDRVGPRRATASGLVSPSAMKKAVAASFGVAAVCGIALSFAVGPEILLVGVLSFVAALGYSGGPRPYASAGLGEVFVFVFFGLVATIGSAYVQVDRFVGIAAAAAVPVGLLATAILIANNLRDIETDAKAGKRTLAVRLGRRGTVSVYRAVVLGSFLAVPSVCLWVDSLAPLLSWAALPLAFPPLALVGRSDDAHVLIRVLVGTAQTQIVFSSMLAVGLWIS
ncbi:MAG: 1,4-dihydroxy-2-naphthoate polyprenyltransferase [Actinomycetota bacterium]|nr:1,4-dihydroxy-2-naphthoate polyprenyltransferase [Actinomycetota bacterium]